MKAKRTVPCFGLLVCLVVDSSAAEAPALDARLQPSGLQFSWPAAIRKSDGSLVQPYFELERSSDLREWHPAGERMRKAEAAEGDMLEFSAGPGEALGFYRLRTIEPRLSELASGGAEVFGYAPVFSQKLTELGQISVAEFEQKFGLDLPYLPNLGWDPTQASFWENFNADPSVVNRDKAPGTPGYRTFDFRLNAAELEVFKKNGFVVSERLGSGSMADIYYRIWHNDLPVFVSTDAILHAWHRTYDSMLEEAEETHLYALLRRILEEMTARLPDVQADCAGGPLAASVLDADYFLAVARSLLAGAPVASRLGQDAAVAETLADVGAMALKEVQMFGSCRTVDFSQFQVRGHYTHSARLGNYFRCVMWLGRTDFPMAGGPFERCPGAPTAATPREAGGAIVLWDLLHRSGQFQAWLNFDRVTEAFVGWSDSMNFGQLGGLLAGAGIRSVRDVTDLAQLERLQSDLMTGNLGVQNIRSDFFVSPLGEDQIQLPRAFHFSGQKFVPDSWVFAQTVFDSILWNGQKVQRRVPSALDAAFAVFKNDQVVPELVARMNNADARNSLLHAERWRDGLPYQHNLAALRQTLDSQDPAAWNSNIYMAWLAALRELSAPTTDAVFPEAMRTRAWAMKTLNTQLASWTQLRHDTILYAKQSYTGFPVCFYPHGFVEPRVGFWQALARTTERAADLMANLPTEGSYSWVNYAWTGNGYERMTNTFGFSEIQSKQAAHLRQFTKVVETLAALSQKELAQEPFDADDVLFIRNLVQNVGMLPYGSGGVRKYDGWYPELFYRGIQLDAIYGSMAEAEFHEKYGANSIDRLVADVHTDLPALTLGDPGSVLHQGVGNVNLLMVAIDNGPDRMIFAGPVLSHYEFEVVGSPRRLDDTEWDTFLSYGWSPLDLNRERIEGAAPPAWTRSYLVPQ